MTAMVSKLKERLRPTKVDKKDDSQI